MPKLEDITTHFELDAQAQPLNSVRAVIKGTIDVGLVESGSGIILARTQPFGQWTDSTDTPYASQALLLTAIGTICYG